MFVKMLSVSEMMFVKILSVSRMMYVCENRICIKNDLFFENEKILIEFGYKFRKNFICIKIIHSCIEKTYLY